MPDDPAESVDPDRLHDYVREVGWLSGDSGVRFYDACWWLLSHLDVSVLAKHRRRLVGFLGRYGHQSMMQWGEFSTNEMQEFADDILELLKEESLVQSVSER